MRGTSQSGWAPLCFATPCISSFFRPRLPPPRPCFTQLVPDFRPPVGKGWVLTAPASAVRSEKAWELASNSLRNASTGGGRGTKLDHFGKPVGFSGRLYNTLRENISKRDQVTLDETKYAPAFERQDDSRFQWHRTRSEVELGEDEKRVRSTHYKELFGDKPQGKTRNACHSSLDMMRSQYRLEDGSAPQQKGSVSTLSMQDPKVVYPKLSLPQTTSSTVKLDVDSMGDKGQRSRDATSYARNHLAKKAAQANNNRYSWNRTQSTVKIENHYSRETGMKASLMREAFGAPDNTSLKQTLGHKDRGAAKWNKSSSEFKAFAPTQELRVKFATGDGQKNEPVAFQKRPRASIAGAQPPPELGKIMQGPAGAFAHSENGEEPSREVEYQTSTSRTFTKKPVKVPQAREHTRTKSTVELGTRSRDDRKDLKHYDTTTKCHIGVDANNTDILKPQTRFQWGRTQSKIDLKFAVDERGRAMRGKTLRERQRLEALLLKAQGGPPGPQPIHPIGQGDSRHMVSSVALGTEEGYQSQTQHSESFQPPKPEPGYKPCARAMGDVRSRSQVPVPKLKKGQAKAGFKTWSAEVFKPHAPQPMQDKIVNPATIKGHLQWVEQDP